MLRSASCLLTIDHCCCVVWLVQVEEELKSICEDILQVLEKHLIPCAVGGESRVFYYKMYVTSLFLFFFFFLTTFQFSVLSA